jgi:hypothetical protein
MKCQLPPWLSETRVTPRYQSLSARQQAISEIGESILKSEFDLVFA